MVLDSPIYDTADRLVWRILTGGREIRSGFDSSGNPTTYIASTPFGEIQVATDGNHR